MVKWLGFVLAAQTLIAGFAAVTLAGGASEREFVTMFNGRDLSGWEGQPGWWRVEDHAITSESTADKPCEKHTYLLWKGGAPGDFELRLQYRIAGGNSGIQIRSREAPPWDTNGYQADIDAAGEWTGSLFEHARGGIAMRGQRVVVDKGGRRTVAAIGDPQALLRRVKSGDWNDYRIVAAGDAISLHINGVLMSHVVDQQADRAARRGIIALQMHPGPPMKVQFRNLRIRIDDASPRRRGPDASAARHPGSGTSSAR